MPTIRLNKFISQTGYCSRRKADELITSGKVLVNDIPVTILGSHVDPKNDNVRVNHGPILKPPSKTILLALHKPKGYVCTKFDPFHAKTIYSLLPSRYQPLKSIGRLDKDSEGLILLTNNGDLANIYAHPRHQKQKTYIVEVAGRLSESDLGKIEKGMHLKAYKTNPAHAKILGHNKEKDRTIVEIHLKEGRKRQIRNMFLALKHPVKKLVRTAFGPYSIGHLKRGEFREVEVYVGS